MFTGIVTDVGSVRAIRAEADARLEIATHYDAASIVVGASMACSGPCLTIVAKGEEGGRGWFAVNFSAETRARTTLGNLKVGAPVNLERPLKVGEEIGGHIVTGHIDGVARVTSIAREGGSLRFVFQAPDDLKRFIAPKGSIALDGVSLTVNEVEGATFGVNIIPHTAKATTFGTLKTGDGVNLEIDVLARYVARLQAA